MKRILKSYYRKHVKVTPNYCTSGEFTFKASVNMGYGVSLLPHETFCFDGEKLTKSDPYESENIMLKDGVMTLKRLH